MSSEKNRAGRTSGVTLAAIEKRNRCVVALHLSGLTSEEILEATPILHIAHQWGNISSKRQVQRILSKHFEGRPMTAKQVMAYTSALRDAALSGMEKTVELLALYAHSVRDTNPTLYFEALKAQADVQMKIIDAHGFNATRTNYGKWSEMAQHGARQFQHALELAGGRERVTEDFLKYV
ncbi:MAG: hypothetical protein PHO20_00640 [Candidatus Peribacteraceae bacterium]|nr:hypothetical protein [Candidatus Peribacteraceae bacterium]MDD5739259.1 hypothetical protein [Candidatus Peribacteraceae bacterium]